MPGAIKWREECKDFFYNITEYIYEHSNRTEQASKIVAPLAFRILRSIGVL